MYDKYWELGDIPFKGLLYDSIGLYFEYSVNITYNSWEEFFKKDPHMAYADLINIRFTMLEQQFIDLNIVPQMLGVENVPLQSSVENINRHQWLKAITDLALFRFSSIRDILFHFVNEVLELNIKDYQLNIKSFKKSLSKTHPIILADLKKINDTYNLLSKERNERVHKGFYNLFTDDDEMFKIMSNFEMFSKLENIHNYDLVTIYENSKEKIYTNIITPIDSALLITLSIINELYIPYKNTFKNKALLSVHGIEFSSHFHRY